MHFEIYFSCSPIELFLLFLFFVFFFLFCFICLIIHFQSWKVCLVSRKRNAKQAVRNQQWEEWLGMLVVPYMMALCLCQGNINGITISMSVMCQMEFAWHWAWISQTEKVPEAASRGAVLSIKMKHEGSAHEPDRRTTSSPDATRKLCFLLKS